jgi:hypothetical protein
LRVALGGKCGKIEIIVLEGKEEWEKRKQQKSILELMRT